MPNKLRLLSGKEVVGFCERHNFKIASMKGSHVNLAFDITGNKHITTVPLHKEIARGTLHTIYKRLKKFISEEEVKQFFYTSDK
jgi:predicted RNA binding protein YcfA (HicA-like mRNA interferase family)